MKTKEELNALKEEVETLNRKLHELTDEELEQVSGGGSNNRCDGCEYNSNGACRSYMTMTECPHGFA